MEKIKTTSTFLKQTDAHAVQESRSRIKKRYRSTKKVDLFLTSTRDQRDILTVEKVHHGPENTNKKQQDQHQFDSENADYSFFAQTAASPPRVNKIYTQIVIPLIMIELTGFFLSRM
jgi:hypothetical protein